MKPWCFLASPTLFSCLFSFIEVILTSKICICISRYNMMIWYCEIITQITIKLMNTSISSSSYLLLFLVKHRIYSLSKFQVYSIAFINIVTTLHTRVLELNYILTLRVVPFARHLPISPDSQPLTATNLLCFCGFNFSGFYM